MNRGMMFGFLCLAALVGTSQAALANHKEETYLGDFLVSRNTTERMVNRRYCNPKARRLGYDDSAVEYVRSGPSFDRWACYGIEDSTQPE